MRISEVESITGIPKKSIRFYEQERLLKVRRSDDNGYRDYTEAEIFILKKIKVYRKLSLPVDEIRRIIDGELCVGEALDRHKSVLYDRIKDAQIQLDFCKRMAEDIAHGVSLSPDEYLKKMDELERGGAHFENFYETDRQKKIRSVWISVIVFALVFLAVSLLFLCLFLEDEIPWWAFAAVEASFIVPVVGVFLAGRSRIKEISGGEEDDLGEY
ncbi:MAG: MerR family transcriptional regulator [Acutalibacteraceae bacterium]